MLRLWFVVLCLMLTISVGLAQISGPPSGIEITPWTSPTNQTFNVSAYGARCDGITDDTAAITAAVAAWKATGQNSAPVLQGPGLGNKCKVTGPINFTNTAGASPFGAVVQNLYLYGVFNYTGPVGSLGTVTQGSSYTNGTYTNVPMTGGTGSGCTAASITIAGVSPNQTWAITLSAPGCGTGYATGDTLSVSNANVGGTGSGFSVPVTTLSGGSVIDATGSRFVHWDNVVVEGDCTNIPNVLIALARYNAQSADTHIMSNAKLIGCWQFTALLNFASEDFTANQGYVFSSRSTGGYYGVVLDGINHFNWSSPFKAVALAIDTAQSFNAPLFNSFTNNISLCSSCTPWWISRVFQGTWTNTYTAGIGTCGATIYQISAGTSSIQLSWRAHFETSALTNVFCLQGGVSSFSLADFEYFDVNPLIAGNVFAPSGSAAVVAWGLKVKIASMNGAATLYGNNTIWTVTPERIEVPASGNYVAPGISRVGGQICIGSAACTGS